MKLKEIIKSAKRIEVDVSMGKGSTAVKVTKKDALIACKSYLETESIFDCEWRNENDEIIAQAYSDGALCIGI